MHSALESHQVAASRVLKQLTEERTRNTPGYRLQSLEGCDRELGNFLYRIIAGKHQAWLYQHEPETTDAIPSGQNIKVARRFAGKLSFLFMVYSRLSREKKGKLLRSEAR